MAPHPKKILATMACLAIAFGQIFGLHRGFVCDFGGSEHVTQFDHCHGQDPHEDEDDHGHHEGPWNCAIQSADSDEHKHGANIESFRASIAHTAQVVIPRPLFTQLPATGWPQVILATLKTRLSNASFGSKANRARMHWPHVLSHTLALRI